MSLALAKLHTLRTGKHSSPIYVPFVGPVVLDCWLVLAGHSVWMLPLPWLLDIATLTTTVAIVVDWRRRG